MTNEIVYEDEFLSVEKDQNTGWRFVRTTDAAAVLVYVPALDSILVVSQQRPPMISAENPSGKSIEAVAGRLDYNVGVKKLIANELKEEAGISVEAEVISLLNFGKPLASSSGFATEKKYLGYVEVEVSQIENLDNLDQSYGNRHEGENIERSLIKVKDLEKTEFQDVVLFALVQWFLKNHHKRTSA